MARRGARRARSDKQDGADSTQAINQQPFFHPQPLCPAAATEHDQLEAIHQASMTMLEQTGVEVNSAGAQLYKQAGAEVDEASQIVRLSEQLITELLATAPSNLC